MLRLRAALRSGRAPLASGSTNPGSAEWFRAFFPRKLASSRRRGGSTPLGNERPLGLPARPEVEHEVGVAAFMPAGCVGIDDEAEAGVETVGSREATRGLDHDAFCVPLARAAQYTSHQMRTDTATLRALVDG